jgi:hypothetical protein
MKRHMGVWYACVSFKDGRGLRKREMIFEALT